MYILYILIRTKLFKGTVADLRFQSLLETSLTNYKFFLSNFQEDQIKSWPRTHKLHFFICEILPLSRKLSGVHKIRIIGDGHF